MTTIRRPSSARQVVSLESGESAPASGPFALGETSQVPGPPYPGPPSPGPLPIGAAFALGGMGGEDGADGFPGVPGPQGPQGPAGPAGAGGQSLIGPPGLDGDEGAMGIPIPGPAGPMGATGATGPQGPIGFGVDGADGEEGMPVPGPQGPSGVGGWTLIQEQVPVSTGTVTFTGVPSSFRDIRVIVRGAAAASATFEEVHFLLNNDTGSNYVQQFSAWNNSTSNAGTNLTNAYGWMAWLPGATGPASDASVSELIVYDYKGTSFHKAFVTHGGLRIGTLATNYFVQDSWGLWTASPAAVTRVDVLLASGNFASGSTVSLYGSL